MIYKIILRLLLLTGNTCFAQESNLVIYDHFHWQTKVRESGKKKQECVVVLKDREAQLVYSLNYLLFKSPQGTDTVFLPGINKCMKDFLYGKKFDIVYNNKSDVVTLLFCNRKNAKKFKRLMQENGRYRKFTVLKILMAPLIVPGPYSLPDTWYKWRRACQ